MRVFGIYGVSGQSGTAYLADLSAGGVAVYGYARETAHGREVVETFARQGGVRVERPENAIEESSRFVPLPDGAVGHDLERLVTESDVLIFSHPAVYHEETARLLRDALLARATRLPIVLSPSRTLATPYLWEILGERYPLVTFQTCPSACKSFSPGSVYIKRRKRAWMAVLEGEIPPWLTHEIELLFPQAVLSHTPATTSLGNVGAVLHPAAYLTNLDQILAAARRGIPYSFYVDGIAGQPEVGRVVEAIDQLRLELAHAIGCPVFGRRADPREDEWTTLAAPLSDLPPPSGDTIRELRRMRARHLAPLRDTVVSVPHWLAYTYGLDRIPGESVASAVARTPTFQDRSYPQARYADEDVPTGLVPFEALAARLGVDGEPARRVIDLYERLTGRDARAKGRNLERFPTSWLSSYLRGNLGHTQR